MFSENIQKTCGPCVFWMINYNFLFYYDYRILKYLHIIMITTTYSNKLQYQLIIKIIHVSK